REAHEALASLAETDAEVLADRAERLLDNAPDWGGNHAFGRRHSSRKRDPRGRPENPQGRPRFGPEGPFERGRSRELMHPGNRGPGSLGNGLPWGVNLYVAGWAHFRAGQYDQAIERLEQSNPTDSRWPARGISYPVLAMAYHQAGQGEKAQQALAKADALMNQWAKEISQAPAGRLPIPWFDWIEFLVNYREAKILITGFAPPDDPRLLKATNRALAAIDTDGSSTEE
ncbi:MAG: tetratricopeptide repeat protein, partial [Planctomycetaceae bacterium]|nr:tetratricopeptide repeat protein [Planctomycetaceae bacterium]